MELYRCEEWQNGSLWYCEHIKTTFNKETQLWVVPSRILDMTADDFIKFLIKEFCPDRVYGREDGSFVGWGWKSQAKMRLYKNFINAKAREVNYQV